MDAGFVFFDHRDGALLECGFELRKGVSEEFVDVEGARIVHTQQHNRRVSPTRKGQQVTESKIHGEDDAVFGAGFFNNGFIGKALEALLTEMHGVVTVRSKPRGCLNRQRHVDEQPHGTY